MIFEHSETTLLLLLLDSTQAPFLIRRMAVFFHQLAICLNDRK